MRALTADGCSRLVGEGDVLRVTVTSPGGKAPSQYTDFLQNTAPSTTASFAVKTSGARDSVLSTTNGIFTLTVGAAPPTTALAINGVVVSKELKAISTANGADCLPPGWKEL